MAKCGKGCTCGRHKKKGHGYEKPSPMNWASQVIAESLRRAKEK